MMHKLMSSFCEVSNNGPIQQQQKKPRTKPNNPLQPHMKHVLFLENGATSLDLRL